MGKLSDALRRAEEERRRHQAADPTPIIPDTTAQPDPVASVAPTTPTPETEEATRGPTGKAEPSTPQTIPTAPHPADGTPTETAPSTTPLPPVLPRERPRRRPDPRLICYHDRHDMVAELFQQLRTRLLALEGTPRVILFTSTAPGEGKTIVCANLAVAMADYVSGPVLAIDGDLRKPQLHEVLGCARAPGLGEVLSGTVDLTSTLQPTPATNLHLLPAGGETDNPTALLGSVQARTLIKNLRQQFKYILVDSPPVMTVTDASVLGAYTDGAVMVVRAGKTDREAVARAIDVLGSAGVVVLGTVLNAVRQPRSRRYYYRYYEV